MIKSIVGIIGLALIAVFIILGAVLVALPFSIYSAWIISTVWNWFLPTFGVPVITITHAFGIQLLISLLFGGLYMKGEKIQKLVQGEQKDKSIKELFIELGKIGATSFSYYTIGLIIAYVLHTIW